MKNYPGIKVVTLESNWKLERAQELMKQYLDNGGHADGVFGHSDLGAIGAFLEAERRGIDKQMLIVGIDGLPGEWEGVDRVKRTVCCFLCLSYPGRKDYGIGDEYPSG